MTTSRPDADATTPSESSVVGVSLVGPNDGKVMSVNGEPCNVKVTNPSDDRVAAALVDASPRQSWS